MKVKLKKGKPSETKENKLMFDTQFMLGNISIGKIEYEIDKNEKSGRINYTYLFPEHRGAGVLKSNIDNILCDMKCAGADTVKLETITDDAKNAWKRLGFIVLGDFIENGIKKTELGIDLFTRKCRCKHDSNKSF